MQDTGAAMEHEYRSNGFVHAVYDESPYGIIVFNAQLEIIDWNPAVEKFAGLSKSECLGNNVLEVFEKASKRGDESEGTSHARGTLVVAEAISGKFLLGYMGNVKISTIVDKSGAMNGGTLVLTAHNQQ